MLYMFAIARSDKLRLTIPLIRLSGFSWNLETAHSFTELCEGITKPQPLNNLDSLSSSTAMQALPD